MCIPMCVCLRVCDFAYLSVNEARPSSDLRSMPIGISAQSELVSPMSNSTAMSTLSIRPTIKHTNGLVNNEYSEAIAEEMMMLFSTRVLEMSVIKLFSD
ncbi:hypothetical protein KIN20_032344 [Parelaphostrongylus tenuis]|uniref:Uncharacterized protein n=1 Tax=Parelaphostrongylus tenuis TaxID=148309 RepID=A0AAD5R6S4_PARTN|nr:hypothetical protein KIN20_032344 [Parelaphostrongylus tenuis]